MSIFLELGRNGGNEREEGWNKWEGRKREEEVSGRRRKVKE